MFDTLAYSKYLQDAGVDRIQAGAQAQAMAKFILPDLATSAQLAAAETGMGSKMVAMETNLKSHIDAKVAASVDSMTWRFVPFVLTIIGLVVAILFRH